MFRVSKATTFTGEEVASNTKQFNSFADAYNYMIDMLVDRRTNWSEKGISVEDKITGNLYTDIVYNLVGNYFAVVNRISHEDYDYSDIGCVKVLTVYWHNWYYVGQIRSAIHEVHVDTGPEDGRCSMPEESHIEI